MPMRTLLDRVRPHRRTVRLRLTLVYGGLFLASSVVLLGTLYLLVVHATGEEAIGGVTSPELMPPPGASPSAAPTPASDQAPPVPAETAPGREVLLAVSAEVAEQRSLLIHQFLIQSLLALAAMSVVSVVLGWIVAGRVLRRLRDVTGAAREISATDLHRRLAFDGPADELKELGDTFDALLDRLEAAFQAQRQFVANASHELRTPLARQRALGQVALADPQATAETLRHAHERILAAGARQERLIGALLTLTKGQVGIEVHERFDLGRVARDVVEQRLDDVRARSLTLRAAIRPTPATGSPGLAERLVTNLVENAVRYNAPGGWIEVTTRTVDGRAALTVANTGPAVPPSAVDRLFRPFQRLDGARTAHRDGLGLGLSIVQAVATAHRASLTAVPRPEGGLSVTVVFPHHE